MKTFDLVLIGWITAMSARFLVGGVVSGAYFIVQELLWFAKRMNEKSFVVV